MLGPLRVLDFAEVSPLRSQTLWHALAYGVSGGAPATVSFCRAQRPCVSIGYHRRLSEIDLPWCQSKGIPVYRRMAGGGPVYVDEHQLLFQLVVPSRALPASRAEALRRVLAWAVPAFRAAGLDAELDDKGEISVGERKVCGHGAFQVGDAVAVVGNLLGRFDHHRATRILALPHRAARDRVEQLMRRYVGSDAPVVDAEAFKDAAVASFAAGLELEALPARLVAEERRRLAELDRLFESDGWRAAVDRPLPEAYEVKIRAGVNVTVGSGAPARSPRHAAVGEQEGWVGRVERAEPAAHRRGSDEPPPAADSDGGGLPCPR